MNASIMNKYNITRDSYYIIGEIFGYYLVPGFSVISFLLNISFARILILNHKIIKQRKYKILVAKSLFNCMLCKFSNAWLFIFLKKEISKKNQFRYSRNWISKLAVHILLWEAFQHVRLSCVVDLLHTNRGPISFFYGVLLRSYHKPW